jgi:hypothetical protein
MHLTQTPPCRRTRPLRSWTPRVLERLLLLRRAARHVAEEDVDVDVVLVVVVIGVPCLSHRWKFVVLSLDEEDDGRDVYGLAFLWMEFALSWRKCV